MKNEITYCSHPTEEKFLNCTRRYISQLFSSVCKGSNIVMVDQIVPSTNLKRVLRYFDDIQVVIVDRDPRDIYVLEKYVWQDGIIPNDVETFCKWFKYTRAHRKNELNDGSKVKFIQFEDMVYKYEETTSTLAGWLGLNLENHVKLKKIFNPAISVKNTPTWKRYPCDIKEIEYIENELEEYLYKFPKEFEL